MFLVFATTCRAIEPGATQRGRMSVLQFSAQGRDAANDTGVNRPADLCDPDNLN